MNTPKIEALVLPPTQLIGAALGAGGDVESSVVGQVDEGDLIGVGPSLFQNLLVP